jgi:RsiW-degrading membrane proteinase PrsW (M82 family)
MQNFGSPQFPPQGYVLRPTSNRRAIKWMLVVLFVLLALLAGSYTLYRISDATGTAAMLTGMLLAALPVPLYILLILWIDRYESEPLWMLALAFFWGAAFATFIAMLINPLVAKTFGPEIALTTSAPIVEESSKGLVLFILFWWKKDEFDGVIDGIVYAGMVGLGFAMVENFEYYGAAAMGSGRYLTQAFLLRGLLGPFSHPLFTSMTGIGLGLARQSNNKAAKFFLPIIGLLAAMLLHFAWNRSALSGVFGMVYALIMIPVFIGAILAIVYALRREGRIVREHLWCDCQRGLFTFDEYYRLCNIQGRMSASYRALKTGGIGLWRTRMKFNQMASELAFHRSRVQRGMLADQQVAYEREMAYVNHLFELRRRLGQF